MSKNGLHLITPTSVDKTGASSTATISANGSVEFASCETLSLNGVFSADYDNYMVVIRMTPSTDTYAQMRLRAAGTDNSTASSYTRQLLEAKSTTITAGRTSANISDFLWARNVQRSGAIAYFYGPFLGQPTAYRTVSADDVLSASIIDLAGTHNQSVSYDGFSLIIGVGSLSGRVAVYGMRK